MKNTHRALAAVGLAAALSIAALAGPAQAAPKPQVTLIPVVSDSTVSFVVTNYEFTDQTVYLRYETEDGFTHQTLPVTLSSGERITIVSGLPIVEGNGIIITGALISDSGATLETERVRESR